MSIFSRAAGISICVLSFFRLSFAPIVSSLSHSNATGAQPVHDIVYERTGAPFNECDQYAKVRRLVISHFDRSIEDLQCDDNL